MIDLSHIVTWREIHAQPAVWRDWGHVLDVAGLRSWVASLDVAEVWFCGAGSSAYLGDIIVAALEGAPGPRLRAIPTTDLVARPLAYLSGANPLVVNFGRSGNSAETIGTLDALDALAPDAPRLNITCNAISALATRSARNQRSIILPPATHDAGFAMTSSFSTMLLTALAIFDRAQDASTIPLQFAALSDQLSHLLPQFTAHASTARIPERAVFVGSGALTFAARESALKVMELTAGQIPVLWDSTLGFRHGPKSFVRGQTDIWLFGSSDPHTARYDTDLLAELRQQFPQSTMTLVAPDGDLDVQTAGCAMILPVVLAQVLAVVWSRRLGLAVDDPFAGQGTLSRVVADVRLYPVGPA